MQTPSIIHINGAPGVGKLTVGRLLSDRIGARLLDNHVVHDLAFALTTFRSPEWYALSRAARGIAYEEIARSSTIGPVVLTNALFEDSPWGQETWRAVVELATQSGALLWSITLLCKPDEHRRRIVDPGRNHKSKVRDASYVDSVVGRALIAPEGIGGLILDASDMSADVAAATISLWLENRGK